MLKKVLSIVLTALLTNVAAGVVYARSQDDQEALRIEKIKESVRKLGIGKDARVEAKLQDGRKVKGYIREATDHSFTVVEDKTGIVGTVNYSEVIQLKGRNGLTAAKVGINVAKGVAIFAATGAAFALLMYLFIPRT